MLVLVVAFIVMLYFYDPLLDFISKPYYDAVVDAEERASTPGWWPPASAPVCCSS